VTGFASNAKQAPIVSPWNREEAKPFIAIRWVPEKGFTGVNRLGSKKTGAGISGGTDLKQEGFQDGDDYQVQKIKTR